MTPDFFKQAGSRIREKVDEAYVDPSGRAAPIYDGIIDEELYCSSTPRVMWILKEPWDDEGSSGGGWSLCSDLLAITPVSSLSQSTFHPIIYIAYGLFNGLNYEEMPWIRDMKDAEITLRRLAFINAKKLPGVTRGARASSILAWYGRGRDVIRDQISSYDPQIIFGCAPHFSAILDDMNPLWRDAKQTTGSAEFVRIDQKLFVHVYHPGQTRIKRKTYVDDALMAVRLSQ